MRILWKIFRFLLIIVVGLEIFLQFYNPFSSRIKHQTIILPKNIEYKIEQNKTNSIDSLIVHSKNNLGFRGENYDKTVQLSRIFCLGGSTTECFYLSNGKDWPNLLGQKLKTINSKVWLNNAGMDGHSTFGNLNLLEKQILKLQPNYIILMCGLNDITLDTANKFEVKKIGFFRKLYNALEIPATIINLRRVSNSVKSGLNHQIMTDIRTADTLHLTNQDIEMALKNEKTYLKNYEKRLNSIYQICKKNKIKLILVTQAILFSDEKDLLTDIDLGLLKTGEQNGKLKGKLMSIYNQKTISFARKKGIKLVELAERLPKDSRFYYDGYHFSNYGSEMVADVIFDETKQIFKK